MDHQSSSVPKAVFLGLLLSLSAILFGFILGGAFGGIESSIKAGLERSGTAVLETVYKGDAAARDAVVKKSWGYLQRAHLHGGALGTAALACILALVILTPLGSVERLSSLAVGSGAVLYSVFWLLAGLSAPAMGSTGAAKEALKFLAVPGAGLSIMGVCGTIFCVARAWRARSPR